MSKLCFYFALGNFSMLFRVSQSFPKVGEGEFLGKKTKTQYLNIKQVYKFSAESTKELKRLFSNVGFLYNLIRQNLQKSWKVFTSSMNAMFLSLLQNLQKSWNHLYNSVKTAVPRLCRIYKRVEINNAEGKTFTMVIDVGRIYKRVEMPTGVMIVLFLALP